MFAENYLRKNAWKIFMETLLRSFRLSEYELSKITGIRQSTINRITRGETEQPYQSTIKKFEDSLHIDIIDTDENNITFRKRKIEITNKSGAGVNEQQIRYIDTTHPLILKKFPLITTEDERKMIQQNIKDTGTIDFNRIESMIKCNIELPYPNNGIAAFATTDMNLPFIKKGDIVLADYEAQIDDNDLVFFLDIDNNVGAGRLKNLNHSAYRVTPLNAQYPPITLPDKSILILAKIVLTIQNW